MKSIIAFLKESRLIKTNQDLSDALGVSTKAVSDWTNEKYPPTFDKIKKISQIYGISILIRDDKISCQFNNLSNKKPKQKKDSFYEIIDKVTDTNQTLVESNKNFSFATINFSEGTKNFAIASKEGHLASKIMAKSINMLIGK